jgi:hypothetical protein
LLLIFDLLLPSVFQDQL